MRFLGFWFMHRFSAHILAVAKMDVSAEHYLTWRRNDTANCWINRLCNGLQFPKPGWKQKFTQIKPQFLLLTVWKCHKPIEMFIIFVAKTIQNVVCNIKTKLPFLSRANISIFGFGHAHKAKFCFLSVYSPPASQACAGSTDVGSGFQPVKLLCQFAHMFALDVFARFPANLY